MKLLQNKNSNSRLVSGIIIGVLALSLITGVVYAYNVNQSNNEQSDSKVEDGVDYNEPTNEQIEAGNDAKEDALTEEPVSNTASLTISSVNQNDDMLQIRTTITTIDAESTCSLSLTSGSNTYTAEAGTQPLGSYSVCKGFDIPVSELSPGAWSLKINYISNGVTSTATQQIQVQ